MKFYGNIALQQNELQAATLQTENDFPEQPVVGRVIFKDKVVYICVEIATGIPIWVPLTREVNTYIHNQDTSSSSWSINHNLKSGTVTVQVYDQTGYMIVPDEVNIQDRDNVTIVFNQNQAGRAIIMAGDLSGNPKVSYAYEHYQNTPSSSWVIPHALGYNPIVRVFIGNQEVQPAGITYNNSSVLTITFSAPYAGVAKLI